MNLDDFTFDEDLHIYRNAQNVVRPSVTQTLKIAGAIDYSMVPPELLERKRVIGTNVHAWTADFDRTGYIDELSLTEEEWGYAQGWLKFVDDVRPQWIEVEKSGLATIAGMEVGGTPDRVCIINRRMYILDIKCAASLQPAWALQLADYEMMRTGHSVVGLIGRMSVRLTADGRYLLKPYEDPNDAAGALACLGVAVWKLNNGLAKVA